MDWWEIGNYNGEACRNCGRQRVMIVDAPDGMEHRVCEKCAWDQDASLYARELVFSRPTPEHKEE